MKKLTTTLAIIILLLIAFTISVIFSPPAHSQDSVVYLGEGKGKYTLPEGYDVLIVKRFHPYRAEVVEGGSYSSWFEGTKGGHLERVWACSGEFCRQPIILFMSQVSISSGSRISTFILDDDTKEMGDERRPQLVDSHHNVLDTIESAGLAYHYTFKSNVSGTVNLDSEDSIIIFPWDVVSPTPTAVNSPTPTLTSTPTATETPVSTYTPTETSVNPPTDEPKSTSAPSAVPTSTPTATETTAPTATHTKTPKPTQTPVEIVDAPKAFYHTLSVGCDGKTFVSIEGRDTAKVNIYLNDQSKHSGWYVIPEEFTVHAKEGDVVKVVVDDGKGTSYIRESAVSVPTCPFADIALRKTLHRDQHSVVSIGDSVVFSFEVINQGSVELTDIVLVDYIPEGFKLFNPVDSIWQQSGNDAVALLGSLPVGQTLTVEIVLIVEGGVATNRPIYNYAEVSSAEDDVDSEGDSINGNSKGESGSMVDNEVNNAGGDEDDHDVEEVTVSQPSNLQPAAEVSVRVLLPFVTN